MAVLADDLIWSTRLADALRAAGADPLTVRSVEALDARLDEVDATVVDLTARAYDGVAAIERAGRLGRPVLAVGQHDDVALRKRALAAGADRVYAYRKLFEDGPATLRSWLARSTRFRVTRSSLPPISAERYEARLRGAVDELRRRGARALLVGVGPDLEYLTGYRALPLERLTMLVLPVGRPPLLVVPRLEEPAARAGLGVPVELAAWGETDDPYDLVARWLEGAPVDLAAPVGVSDRLWASHLLRLEARLPGARFEPASRTLRALRAVKDAEEIERLRRAAQAADRVIEQIAAGRLVGRTEADVAAEVRERLVAEGHDQAEFAIVAAGPNSASPHHEASGRVIAPGEPIVLDIGGSLGGYGSDITRTIWVAGADRANGPDATFREIYELVRRAQAEATAAVRPGVPAERIDAVAREVIAAGGFGPQFIHRTGHGIGLEAHEDPYLVAGNDEPLQRGAAFSVEPGIYLDGRYGVRIEDIVVCGTDGPDVLNTISRELRVVAG